MGVKSAKRLRAWMLRPEIMSKVLDELSSIRQSTGRLEKLLEEEVELELAKQRRPITTVVVMTLSIVGVALAIGLGMLTIASVFEHYVISRLWT